MQYYPYASDHNQILQPAKKIGSTTSMTIDWFIPAYLILILHFLQKYYFG